MRFLAACGLPEIATRTVNSCILQLNSQDNHGRTCLAEDVKAIGVVEVTVAVVVKVVVAMVGETDVKVIVVGVVGVVNVVVVDANVQMEATVGVQAVDEVKWWRGEI
jgi:hypothetical protein